MGAIIKQRTFYLETKNCNSEHIDSDSNPNSVLLNKRQRGFEGRERSLPYKSWRQSWSCLSLIDCQDYHYREVKFHLCDKLQVFLRNILEYLWFGSVQWFIVPPTC